MFLTGVLKAASSLSKEAAKNLTHLIYRADVDGLCAVAALTARSSLKLKGAFQRASLVGNSHQVGLCRESCANVSLALAAGCFSIVFLSYAIGLAVLALGGSIQGFILIAACGGAALVTVLIARQAGLRSLFIFLLIIILLAQLLTSLNTASSFFDISWDGMTYHQEAVIRLAEGWNPLHQTLGDDVPHAVWIRHYPKAAWIFSASAYLLTGSIESGKAFQFLLGWTAFLLSFSAALRIRQLGLLAALLVGVVAMGNPVAIYQSLSFYVDGALSSSITAMVALSVILYLRPTWLLAAFLCIVSIFAINLKFIGILYVLIGGIGLAGIAAVASQFTVARLAAWSVICAFTLGTAVFGYDPYIKNTVEHGHPFFPLRGEHAVDIMAGTTPRPLLQMGQLEKLSFSLFHESYNGLRPALEFKIPLIVTPTELFAFQTSDIRLGGWGPLFGGILILAFCAAAVLLAVPKSRHGAWAWIATVGLLLASVLANPEAWWARYTPQFWLVPLVVCIALLTSRGKTLQSIGLLIGLLMLGNSWLIADVHYRFNDGSTERINYVMSRLAVGRHPVTVTFGPFQAVRVRFEEAGVPTIVVRSRKELTCATPWSLRFYFGEVRYCDAQLLPSI
jgi:hypothetical protein